MLELLLFLVIALSDDDCLLRKKVLIFRVLLRITLSHKSSPMKTFSILMTIPALALAVEPPFTKVGFEKIQLLDKYVSEGASVGDVDKDGELDVIAGNLWWKGPDFKESFSYGPVKYHNLTGPGLSGYSENFFTFPDFISEDDWLDIIKVGLPGQNSKWAKNPGQNKFDPQNTDKSCDHGPGQKNVCNEAPQYVDVIGDEKKELLSFSHGGLTIGIPHADETTPWKFYFVGKGRGFGNYEHGLGVGDINGDGLKDILEKDGWWEQPKDWDKLTHWTFHKYPFNAGQKGGADMYADDVDGDGDADVITSLNGHGYGLAWFEQVKKKKGKITFKKHDIMTNKASDNPYGVAFSQLHALEYEDVDGDGRKDIITGKCYFAHNGRDPGGNDPAVLYWFRNVKDKDDKVQFIPYEIDNDSGIGRQFSTADLNKDGKLDIITANKKGVHVFIQKKAEKGDRGVTSGLDLNDFTLAGQSIKLGRKGDGRTFIGWWPKEATATVPVLIQGATHGGKTQSKKLSISADIAAADEGGGVLQVLMTTSADPTAKIQPVKSWSVPINKTGSWDVYAKQVIGEIELAESGSYYLHFLVEQMNEAFIDLSNVTLQTEPFAAFEVTKPKEGPMSTLNAGSYLLTGPGIKVGNKNGRSFAGWWPKEGIATVPITLKKATHDGDKDGKQITIEADIAAANGAGGIVKVLLTTDKDPKAAVDPLKSWTIPAKITGDWYNFENQKVGAFEFPKAGTYYLHFICEKINNDFINLADVRLKMQPNAAYEVAIPKPRRGAGGGGGLKAGNAMNAVPLTIDEQKDGFILPDGFVAELVSSEEYGAVKPISIAFDDAGRLWTQTAREYPKDNQHDKFAAGGVDQIIVIDEPWKKGPHKPRVWAEGLVMPVSVLPHNDGVYMMHGPDIEFLQDTNGDGKADSRKKLVTGFGIQDTHTTAHQLTRTPGGWIAFSQGCNGFGNIKLSNGEKMPFYRSLIARMNLDGTKVEKIGAGMNNIWAWAINDEGRTFIHEANDFGYSQVAFDRDATYPSFVNTKRYPDSIIHPPTAEGLGLGGTGFSGIAVMEDTERGYPKEWQGVNFVANPITGAINSVGVEKDEKGVYHFKKLENLLTSDDLMCRPVAAAFGPDGCLYVIDWYNRIISHNEVSVDHPARDKVSGRIWRIRHESQSLDRPIPNVEKAKDTDLIKHLLSDNTWEARAAWHQIEKRKLTSLAPQLKDIITSSKYDDGQRVIALWALESLGQFDLALWKTLLKSDNENVRFEAVRSLSTLQPSASEVATLLKPLKGDPSWYVKNEVVRFYRDSPAALTAEQKSLLESMVTPEGELPNERRKGWKGDYLVQGGSYEPAFLNLLIQKALNKEAEPVKSVDEAKWNKFIAKHPGLEGEAKKAAYDIIHRVTAMSEKGEGDAVKGKASYMARCASCHNPEMGGFAPALNGGKARDHEAILTAILDPNAAAEAVFNVYRVVKKDGTVFEGFRSKITPEEIEFTNMGGTKFAIKMDEIKDGGYIEGKSVMLENMAAGLSDQDLLDLSSYIRTIE